MHNRAERVNRIVETATAFVEGGTLSTDQLWTLLETSVATSRTPGRSIADREKDLDVAKAAYYAWLIANGEEADLFAPLLATPVEVA